MEKARSLLRVPITFQQQYQLKIKQQRMVQLKDNLLCLFGGVSSSMDTVKMNKATLLNDFYFLNLNEAYWSKAMIGGYLPSSRYCCSLASNSSELCCQLIIFGGKSNLGIKEAALFVLSEIDQNENEQWGYVEEDSQDQDDFLQSAVKEKVPKEVPKINLELSESEKIILQQKETISEKEQMLKKLQLKKIDLRNKYKSLDQAVDQSNKEFNVSLQESQKQLEETLQQNCKNKELIEKLKILLICERKKRKFLQEKVMSLQDSLKQSENFILKIDSLYNKGLKDDLYQGIVNIDALQKLAQKKMNHREILAEFRDEFDQCCQREQTVRKEMKNSKEKLKALGLSKLFTENLNVQEKRVLNIKE